jgi:hypothetical protein
MHINKIFQHRRSRFTGSYKVYRVRIISLLVIIRCARANKSNPTGFCDAYLRARAAGTIALTALITSPFLGSAARSNTLE